MLSSPVYTKGHLRRIAAFASRMNLRDAADEPSCTSFTSFNSFASSYFRTLLRNGRLQPLSFQSLRHPDKKPLTATPLESALIEVVILKNLKLFRMNTYKKHRGEGGCYC